MSKLPPTEEMLKWLSELSDAGLMGNYVYAKKKARQHKKEYEYYSMMESLTLSIKQERFLKEIQSNLFEDS